MQWRPPLTFTTMRITLSVLLVAVSIIATAQREEIIEVPGASALELYQRSERWFANTFRDANNVLQIKDIDQKLLMGKGATTTVWTSGKGMSSVSGTNPAGYSVEAQCKDGRCRFRVYDIVNASAPFVTTPNCEADMSQWPEPKTKLEQRSAELYPELYKQQCEQITALIDGLFATYRAAIKEPPKNDW